MQWRRLYAAYLCIRPPEKLRLNLVPAIGTLPLVLFDKKSIKSMGLQ